MVGFFFYIYAHSVDYTAECFLIPKILQECYSLNMLNSKQYRRFRPLIKRWNGCYSRSTYFFAPRSVPAYCQITGYFCKSCLSHCRTVSRRKRGIQHILLRKKHRKVPQRSQKYRRLPENRKVRKPFLSHCRTFLRVDDSSFLRHKMRRVSSVSTPR